MRHASITLNFEARGVAKIIRQASGRREYRLRPLNGGGVMRGLVLEVMGRGSARWRYHYATQQNGKRVRRKMTLADNRSELTDIRQRWLNAQTRVDHGEDPVADRLAERRSEAERSEATISKLAAEYTAGRDAGLARAAHRMRGHR
jgi:Arm domain-containing DNA-binding protein